MNLEAGGESASEAARVHTCRERNPRKKAAGKGIVGMKILGQGDLSNHQDEALKYALSLGLLYAFTIGAENKNEQEDLIRRIAAA